jgi:hypothetical protein
MSSLAGFKFAVYLLPEVLGIVWLNSLKPPFAGLCSMAVLAGIRGRKRVVAFVVVAL